MTTITRSFRPWSSPFYSGIGTLSEVGSKYQIALGGHGYILEPSECKREFLTQLRPSFSDASNQPGEHLLNPESAWRRSTDAYLQGAGQLYFDDESNSFDPGSSRLRFRSSLGMNVWDNRELKLLPTTHVAKAAASGSSRCQAVSGVDPALGVYLLHDDGTTKKVTMSVNADAASPTFTDCTGLSGNKLWWITTDGINVYVVDGVAGATKIYKALMPGTVFAALTGVASTYVGCAYANGRLFAWKSDGSIGEVDVAGTYTNLYTHPLGTNFAWQNVVAAPNAAYLLGTAGQASMIYRTDVTDATGALSKPVLAGSVDGEKVLAGHFQGGTIAFGFAVQGGSMGQIRVAQIAANGGLVMGPGIVSDYLPSPVYATDAFGEFVYFGWSNYDGSNTGQGRIDLFTATDQGGTVFAYASDLMYPGQGVVRSCLQYNQLRMFTVDGVGLVCEEHPASTVPISGTLQTGRIRFGMLDLKQFANLDAFWDALPAGTSVAIDAAFDDGGNVNVFTNDTDGSMGPGGRVGLPTGRHEWVELTITLTGTCGADHITPVLRWWLLRAVPVTSSAERIIDAIILRDVVNNRGNDVTGIDIDYTVEAELEYLRGLATTKEVITRQIGDTSEDVYVVNVTEQPDRWSWDNSTLEGLVYVETRTLE